MSSKTTLNQHWFYTFRDGASRSGLEGLLRITCFWENKILKNLMGKKFEKYLIFRHNNFDQEWKLLKFSKNTFYFFQEFWSGKLFSTYGHVQWKLPREKVVSQISVLENRRNKKCLNIKEIKSKNKLNFDFSENIQKKN